MVIEAYTKFLVITVESSNISYQMRKVNIITKKLVNASGDPKKTWLLINQLRGKHLNLMMKLKFSQVILAIFCLEANQIVCF